MAATGTVIIEDLRRELRTSIEKVSGAFRRSWLENGQYSEVLEDIAFYYKHPLMWDLLGEKAKANLVLNHIQAHYFREDGDFFPKEGSTKKSKNEAYQEFYTYTNGWIVRAAQQCGRADIASPGLAYLSTFFDARTGGFYTHLPGVDGITDVITTAHLGLIHLEGKKLSKACAAGDYLVQTLTEQPDLAAGFYLRRDASGKSVLEFPSDAAAIFIVDKAKPEQLYFMIAYPIAYLAKLYEATNEKKYLNAAHAYAAFALACNESVFHCEFSHKLAWGLAELYKIDPKPTYLEAINKITHYFISEQGTDGLWFSAQPLKCYDQSAEIACWFMEIENSLGYRRTKEPEFVTVTRSVTESPPPLVNEGGVASPTD